MTIVEAIRQALSSHGKPMTPDGIYDAIVGQRLYEFHAKDPGALVKRQLRRHCEGLQLANAPDEKHFRLREDGRYELIT